MKKIIGLWLLGLGGIALVVACSPKANEQAREFPAFVYGSALSLESYRAAVSLPTEVMTSIPCYCGCVTNTPPHRYLLDCFLLPPGGYTDHAAGCDLCGKIVLEVQKLHQEGVPLKEIRSIVDARYAQYGDPTQTPPVEER